MRYYNYKVVSIADSSHATTVGKKGETATRGKKKLRISLLFHPEQKSEFRSVFVNIFEYLRLIEMTSPMAMSPGSPVPPGLRLPDVIVTRRTRTVSMNGRIEDEVREGTVRFFCRSKGHGFIDDLEPVGILFRKMSKVLW